MADTSLARAALELNPWLTAPDRFSDFVTQRHLPTTGFRTRTVRLPLDTERATLVIGPRQAGKSSLVWRHLADLGPAVLYLTGEEPLVRELAQSPALFRSALRELLPAPSAILIDEAQHLPDAGLLIKALVDSRPGCPVVVTGSSSFHLLARTRESLAGRAHYVRLLPFSFEELRPVGALGPALAQVLDEQTYARQVLYGGYPRVALAPSEAEAEAELHRLVRAVVLRDASDMHRVRNGPAFRRLLELAAQQVGNPVNLSEWSALLEVQRATVADWLALLEDMHVLHTCPVYAGGKRAELTSSRKVFFVDCGLRNALVDSFADLRLRADRGALTEQWVFTELHKVPAFEDRIHYWRTKAGAEVDFVIDLPAGLVGLEVKAGPAHPPRLSKSALSFVQAYRPTALFIVHDGPENTATVEGVPVRWVPLVGFSERVQAVVGAGRVV